MKILITGSSGYIGSNFINTFTYKYTILKFSLLKDTIDDLSINNVDVVLHCAALVHQKVEYDYKTYYDINVKYPISLAKKAKKSGVKQFIFLSTIAVYGEDYTSIDENTVPKPITTYARSKLEAEKQIQELNDNNFIVSIIRPPMVYGKDAPGNMASLIKLINKISILPLGKIDNRRSFVYIKNLNYLIDIIMQKQKRGIFLVADDQPLSTSELIERIAKAMDKRVYLIRLPLFETLLKLAKPFLHKKLYKSLEINNHFTKKMLDFKNTYSAEKGINYMIKGEQI